MSCMAKSITPGPRQFTLMTPGAVVSAQVGPPPWKGASSAAGSATYWTQTYCDLRGMIGVESKSQGLSILSVNLQEADDIFLSPVPDDFAWGWVYDILTTVPLSDEAVLRIGHGLSANSGSYTPGFLNNTSAFGMGETKDEQTLNPSQVVWGSWRFLAANSQFRLALESATQVVQSGLFGQGEIVTSQGLYYTRIVILNADDSTARMPSANLAIWGAIETITEAEEMTQMMRAYQR